MPSQLDQLREGERDARGRRIHAIIARSHLFVVFFTDGYELVIASAVVDDPSNWELEVRREFDALHARIARAIPQVLSRGIRADLGAATFHALSAPGHDTAARTFFEPVAAQLAERAREHARVAYIAGSAGPALVILAAGLTLILTGALDHGTLRHLLAGVLGGTIGALLSVFIRSESLKVNYYAHRYQVAAQGFSRVLLGILFGIVAVAAIKGGVLLSPFAGNNSALFIFAGVAGYSEKFIPELMSRLESQASASLARLPKPPASS